MAVGAAATSLASCGAVRPGDISCTDFMQKSRAQQEQIFEQYLQSIGLKVPDIEKGAYLPRARKMCGQEGRAGFGGSQKLSDWQSWI